MSTPDIQKILVTRLTHYRGIHSRIAKECGIAQATISRVANAQSSPTLAIAQSIFNWMDKNPNLVTVHAGSLAPTKVSHGRKQKRYRQGGINDLDPGLSANG